MFFQEVTKGLMSPNNPVLALVGLQISNKIKEGVEAGLEVEIQTSKIELQGKRAIANLQERQYSEMLTLSELRIEVEEAKLQSQKTEAFASRYAALRDTYISDCKAFGETPSRQGLATYIESQSQSQGS